MLALFFFIAAGGSRMQVDAVHTGTWLGKPPMATITVDLAIKNTASEPRWFFVPRTVGSSGDDAVRAVNTYGGLWQLEGAGFAVRVAGGATVTLARLDVTSWHSPLPNTLVIPCISASELSVGKHALKGDAQRGLVDAHLDPMRAKPDQRREEKDAPLTFSAKQDVEVRVAIVAQPQRPLTPWAKAFELGALVTLEGKAVDAKEGALLLGDGGEIWIDGLAAWPSGYYQGGSNGRRVRVTGVVIEKSDRPVFVDEPGALPKAGVPVAPGTDLQKAARRRLIGNATFVPVQ